MTRKRHTEEQIIAVLKDAQAGIGVPELCRKHGISDATFYKWRAKYAGLEVSDVKKLRYLEGEKNGGPVAGRALWAESATSLSAISRGSEHLALPLSPPGGYRPADTDS